MKTLPTNKNSGSPQARTKVGRYDLIFPLVRGTRFDIYVGALSGIAGFEKLMAIKVAHPHLVTSHEFTTRFLDEARIAARLSHPNVVQIYDVGLVDTTLFTACELVLGTSLYDLLQGLEQQGATLRSAIAADIVMKVCDGLHAAHDLRAVDGTPLGLVHRDICPLNVLISQRGRVKIMDFSSSWSRGRLSHTHPRLHQGRMGYSAPEQIQGEAVDPRADVFSAGALLYRLLVGFSPFPGAAPAERIEKMVAGRFDFPRHVCPDIEGELERIMLMALASKPERRYPSAGAMSRDLRRYLDGRRPLALEKALADLVWKTRREQLVHWNTKIEEHDKERISSIPTAKLRRLPTIKSTSQRPLEDQTTQLIETLQMKRSPDMVGPTRSLRRLKF